MNGKTSWTLPLFLTRETKYVFGIIAFIVASFLYLTVNHTNLFEPQYLPMNWIDRAIPFYPHMVWIYISEYVFFATVYINCRDMDNCNKYIYSFVALQSVSVLIFWLWPTIYPREQFPLPDDLDALTYFAFSTLRKADSPTNCCPSLHVSSVYLSTFIFLDEQKKKFLLFFSWGTAIALSTLPTKQHYIIDVVTGFFMAVIFYWIFHKLITYRRVEWGHKRSDNTSLQNG